MARCKLLPLAFVLVLQSAFGDVGSNIFLSGEYKNSIDSHPITSNENSISRNIFLEHAIFSRQAQPFTAPTYLPPKEFIKCGGGQQCVRKNACIGGYFTNNQNYIQNCEPETDVCCTYRPPPTPTTTTTTQRPYVPCGSDSDCVLPSQCSRGTINVPNYEKQQSTNRCYAPEVCCRLPATVLTKDGYVLSVPEIPFPQPNNPPTYSVPAPTPAPYKPPVRPQYIPPPPPAPPVRPEYIPPSPPAPPVYNPPATLPPQVYNPPATLPPQVYNPPAPPAPPVTPQYIPPAPPRPQPPRYTPPQPTSPPSVYRPPQQTLTYIPPVQPQPQLPRPQIPLPQPPRPQPPRPQPPQPVEPLRPQPPRPQPPRPQPPRPQPTSPPRPINEYLPPRQPQQPLQPLQPLQPQQPRQPYQPQQPLNPIGSPSSNVPIRGEEILSEPIFPSRRPPVFENELSPFTPQKCAAALVCTDINFCNGLGIITDSPSNLTPQQAAFRVPLTDCLIEGSSAPGKCCRDSNYVDPWPVNPTGQCATRNRNTKPRGVTEEDTSFAEIPWQAMVLKESSKSLLCGGAIIGYAMVLTTASCLAGEPTKDILVKAGEWQLGIDDEPLPFQLARATEVEVHPGYNPSTGENNLAIILLEKNLQTAIHVSPICISDKDPSPSERCIVTGWGKNALRIHEQGALMHQTPVEALSRSECGASSAQVCARTKYDACNVDYGSALACGSGDSYTLKGTFTTEDQCGASVATFTKPDIKWINTAFNQNSRALTIG